MNQIARHVHKFGGSSLANADCFLRVSQIIRQYSHPGDLIVVSAAGKTTNRLIDVLELATDTDPAAVDVLESLLTYQHGLIGELLEGESAQDLFDQLQRDRMMISRYLEEQIQSWSSNEILSFGERWSARLLSALLSQQGMASSWLDSRDFLRAPKGPQPQVDFVQSQPLLDVLLKEKSADERVVVTGFIARDNDGYTITLGRNGSDYSATELAALADAVTTTIWSDVAGIYSADPRKVRGAMLLEKLSLAEAGELSRIGASVLHARSLEPLTRSRQKLTLRSSYAPDDGMTQILRQSVAGPGARIVSALEDVYLIDVDFDGHDTCCRELLQILEQVQLKPLTWQQRQDRKTLRLAYTRELYSQAFDYIENWAAKRAFHVQGENGYTLIALVGRGVSEHVEHSGQFFRLLSHQPTAFIQHGPAHLSLTAILPNVAPDPLIKELHQTLFSARRKIGIFVFGKGNIGSRWLALFAREQTGLERRFHQQIVVAGIIGRAGGMIDFDGIDPEQALLNFEPEPLIWQSFLEKLRYHPFDEVIAIDITASETISRYYPELARLGVHLISANKFAGSSDSDFYQKVCQQFYEHGGQWLYNATVGAGLPVQYGIQMLRSSGDTIREISGIFSGTLSWLFQQFDGSRPFSALLQEAWQQGLTEPDPREDLSGQDVRRKLLILVREAGYSLDADQIELQSLVPHELSELSVESFMAELDLLDRAMDKALQMAHAQGFVIRYVAQFNHRGQAKVGLQKLDPHHPFANLRPCDNVFAIQSDWYQENPLVIQGPGAGRDVTAGAIQSDFVNLCQQLS
ncbi:MAG: Bifunctional aspartokinase/homoserine dehydrogenase 2 [Candidatus Celerinatantimonas neptuna]|nr:MAG: Bifunctional aspartokinase/homoserine dehydrogenase 2 [Candidatus Celerinatantimonas neptuna]